MEGKCRIKEKHTLFLFYGSAKRIFYKSSSMDHKKSLSVLPRTDSAEGTNYIFQIFKNSLFRKKMSTIRVTILFISFHFEKQLKYFSFDNYKYGCVMFSLDLEKFRLQSTNKLQSTKKLHLKKCPINTKANSDY